MSKFNFKSQREVVRFLLGVIRCGEKLSIEEENEIMRFILDNELIIPHEGNPNWNKIEKPSKMIFEGDLKE